MKRALTVLALFSAVAWAEPLGCIESGECVAVPVSWLDRLNRAAEQLQREVLKLRASTGCA